MSDVLILSQYNKFIKIAEKIDFEQPFDEKINVVLCTQDLEDYCKKYNISYVKMSMYDFKLMAGL